MNENGWRHGGPSAYTDSFEQVQEWLGAFELLGVPYEVVKRFHMYKDTKRVTWYFKVTIKRTPWWRDDDPDPQGTL